MVCCVCCHNGITSFFPIVPLSSSTDFGGSGASVFIGVSLLSGAAVNHTEGNAHGELVVSLPQGYGLQQSVVVLVRDGESSAAVALDYRQCLQG